MKRVALAFGLLVVLSTGLAYAEGGGGLGLGAGLVKVKDSTGSNLWLTANLRLKVNRSFALEPEVGWYREKSGVTGSSDKQDVINAGGSALFLIPSEQVELFFGPGLGAHMFRTSISSLTSTETKLGYHGVAGVELKASSSLRLFGAVRYEIIPFDGGDRKQWKFYAGLRFATN
jgi:hypothetical protein